MKQTWMTAAVLAIGAACNPDGAGDREPGAAQSGYEARAGGMDTAATPGTSGVGTTGSVSGGSGDTRASATAAGGMLTDAGILARITASNQLEMREAQLAQRLAGSAGVRELAQALERDHSASLETVQALQQRTGGEPDAADQKAAIGASPDKDADLAGKTGTEFDAAFLDRQERLHQKNITDFENQYLAAAQDAELRTLIQQTLPTLRQHLSMIERLQDQQ